MKYLKKFEKLGEIEIESKSTLPEKFEADENHRFALEKVSKFYSTHRTTHFNPIDLDKIQRALKGKKYSKFEIVNRSFVRFQLLTWIKPVIWENAIEIQAFEDDWFIIITTTKGSGCTNHYLADQIEEVINFIEKFDQIFEPPYKFGA